MALRSLSTPPTQTRASTDPLRKQGGEGLRDREVESGLKSGSGVMRNWHKIAVKLYYFH